MSQTPGLAFDQFFRRTDGVYQTHLPQPTDNKRLKQHQRHFLRQPALVKFQLGTDDDDGTAGIIDALAEQILAKTALLALEHIGQRLQGTTARARDRPTMPAVVEQRIHGFLQHAFLIANDHVRRAQLQQVLQPVCSG